MGVGVAGRIQNVLEPRTSRNALRVEPIGLHLQQLVIEASDLLRIGAAGGEIVERQFAQLLAGSLERGDSIGKARKRQSRRIDLVGTLQIVEKTLQRRGVGRKVERQNIGVGEPQRHQSPDARQSDVVFETSDRRWCVIQK